MPRLSVRKLRVEIPIADKKELKSYMKTIHEKYQGTSLLLTPLVFEMVQNRGEYRLVAKHPKIL